MGKPPVRQNRLAMPLAQARAPAVRLAEIEAQEGPNHAPRPAIILWPESLRKLLGQRRVQLRKLRFGTGCTGIDAPFWSLQELGIEMDYYLGSEKSAAARKFLELAEVPMWHIYDDIRKACDGLGYCTMHKKVCGQAQLFSLPMDIYMCADLHVRRSAS